MRLIARFSLLLAVAVAGCAQQTLRDPVTSEAAPAATESVRASEPIAAAERPAPPPEIVLLPKLPVPPFDAIVAAELEPLADPATDLWSRIVAGYGVPEIEGPLVEKWEQWYSERPDYVGRMVDRSRRYLYHIVTEVQARHMPLDIALLPMVESAFNPGALSVSRASGIWQFMPATGKHFGLAQNFWFDSRRDVIAATDKALDYLEKLYADFGDWQLALAAYNWGEGNVAKAIARNQARGLPTDYENLAMPDETRNYLPKLQAIKNIVRDPEKYGLALADLPDAPYFAVVKTSRKIDIQIAADLAEMPLEEFMALNPQHNRPVIAGADEHTILLPIDRAEVFAAKLALHDQPLVSWQAYRLRNGDTLPQIAAKYGLPIETLREVNGLGPRARLHPGHTLLVPAERPSEATLESLSRAVFTTVPQGRTFYHRVNRGDTLSSIAKQYGVTTDELRMWNAMVQSSVQVGQQIRVTSDIVAPARGRGHGSGRSSVATGGARAVKASARRSGPNKSTSQPSAPAVPAGGAKRAFPPR